MPLEDSLDLLETRLRHAGQALDNLLWATVEAQPRQGPGHTLVDYYETAATDAADHARQAIVCLLKIRRVPHSRGGVAAAAKYLRICTGHIGELAECMLGGIGSLRRVAALESLASERKGVWAAWVHGVKDAVADCQQSVGACATALPNCWQSVLGQLLPALGAPAVHATGAKIILNASDARVSNDPETKIATGTSRDEQEPERCRQ